MKLSELAELLEYSDMRSVTKWCNKNGILVACVGKAKYVASEQIENYFDSKFKRFANRSYPNPQSVIKAYEADNKVELAESMGEPVEKKVKKKYSIKKTVISKAAQDFLDNLKLA